MRTDGLADRLAARLARGQAAAEALQLDTFAAHAPNGTVKVDGWDVLAFLPKGSTRGKLQQTSSQSGSDTGHRTVTIGGVERPVLAGGLHIPIGAPVPTAGDQGIGWEYVCTAVGPNSDPALLNRRWLVVSAPIKSHATARRLDVVEVTWR